MFQALREDRVTIEDNPAMLFSIIASFSINELHFGGGKGGG